MHAHISVKARAGWCALLKLKIQIKSTNNNDIYLHNNRDRSFNNEGITENISTTLIHIMSKWLKISSNGQRGDRITHWTTSELYSGTNRVFEEVVIGDEGGACYGMTIAWLEGILKYNLSITSKPSLTCSLLYQRLLFNTDSEESDRIMGITHTQYKEFPTRLELLAEIWLGSDIDRHTGYIFGMLPEDEHKYGHACGYIKRKNRGYLMLPNAGLYSCTSLKGLRKCLRKDIAFKELEKRPYYMFATSYNWN